MKAKISKSINVSDVPKTVSEALQKLNCDFQRSQDSNTTTAHVLKLNMEKLSNIDCFFDSINNTRAILAELDAQLVEYSQIMLGYKNYVSSIAEEKERKALLDEALLQKAKQNNSTPSAPEPPEEPVSANVKPLTKEVLEKLAEINNVNEG